MATYKLVNADQLDSDLALVADSIRIKGGTSEILSFPDGMKTAIDAISKGATVNVITSSYKTDSIGSATVNCGFKPDAVLLTASNDEDTSYGGVGFTGFNQISGGVLLVGPTTNYAYAYHKLTQSSNGFSVSATRYSLSFKSSNDSSRTIDYVAIKYTE